MKLYAESSAILNWLLDQARSQEVRSLLGAAVRVVSSELTLAECHRALSREQAINPTLAPELLRRQSHLQATAFHWEMLHITSAILERAGSSFPIEPVRTLDGIHLASALTARAALPDLVMLSLDDRVRTNAAQLGFRVLPD